MIDDDEHYAGWAKALADTFVTRRGNYMMPQWIIRNSKGLYMRCLENHGVKSRMFDTADPMKATRFDKDQAARLAAEYKDCGAQVVDAKDVCW